MRLRFDYFSVAAGVADHFAFTVDQDLVKYDFKQSASKRQDFAEFLADPAPSRKKARVVLEETNQTDELEVWLQEFLDESDMELWRGMIETEAVLAASEAETKSNEDGDAVDDDQLVMEPAEDVSVELDPGDVVGEVLGVLDLAVSEALACRRSAFAPYRELDPLNAQLGIVLIEHARGPTRVLDQLSNNKPLGMMQTIVRGTTVDTTCHLHPKCRLMLTEKLKLQMTVQTVRAGCILWLAAATVCDEQEHWSLGLKIRRDVYQMKVKTHR